jgi:hypothetical protein
MNSDRGTRDRTVFNFIRIGRARQTIIALQAPALILINIQLFRTDVRLGSEAGTARSHFKRRH